MRLIPISMVLALVAALLTITPVAAHHVDDIDISVECRDQSIVVVIDHDIYGGKKLDWKAKVNNAEDGGSRLPDSRHQTTIDLSSMFPGYGFISIEIKAKASDQSWSKKKVATWEGTCKEPPKPQTLKVAARGLLCGDPRASWKFVNKGDVPAVFQWAYLPGKKSITTRRVQSVTVQPGQQRKIIHRWVRGFVRVSVFDPEVGSYKWLASYRVGKTLKSSRWGTNGCGPGLKARAVDFRKAHVVGTYQNTFLR